MFGNRIDYWLLRPFVHSRNRATEEELNTRFAAGNSFTINAAMSRVEKLVARFEGRFPINNKLRYLDVGCGNGDICIALAKAGCKSLTGVDIMLRNIQCAKSNAAKMKVESKVNFVCKDINNWIQDQKYDVVLSHEALEHIGQPGLFLQSLARLINKDGSVFLAFGPLFHSPLGDHLNGFFRICIPWRGVLFSEKALLRLRREFYRPTDPAESFEEMAGGLNHMRYSQFLAYVNEAGLDLRYLSINPQLRMFPLLHRISNGLVRIPRIRDYVTISVYAMLKLRRAYSNTNAVD